ncbi:MAG: hypothetical protein U0414_03380 [Polyangiaceae bacterium]
MRSPLHLSHHRDPRIAPSRSAHTPRRLARLVAAAALTAAIGEAAGCYDTGDPFVSVDGSETVRFMANGDVEHRLDLTITMPGGSALRHYALESVDVDAQGASLTADPVEFDPSSWPVAVEGQGAVETRSIRAVLREHLPLGSTSPSSLSPRVVLASDDGPIEALGFPQQVYEQEDCPGPDFDGVASTIGGAIQWRAASLPGVVDDVLDVASDGDHVWMASLFILNQPGIRLLHATEKNGVGGVVELAGDDVRLAPGGGGSVLVATQHQGDDGWTIALRDAGLARLWGFRLDGVDTFSRVSLAASGGVALVHATHGAPLSIDGVTIPGGGGFDTLLRFDEASGALIDATDSDPVTDIADAGAGAFALATTDRVVVLEADLTPRWSAEVIGLTDVAVTGDGHVWAVTNGEAWHYDPAGALLASFALPFPPTSIAPRSGGRIRVSDGSTIADVHPDGTFALATVEAAGPEWCTESAKVAITNTALGTAFFVQPYVQNSPAGWRSPAFAGVIAP